MGTSYAPPPIMVRQFKSKSKPSNPPHEVRISRQDGNMYCTCRGWINHKTCRHLKEVTKEDILAALEATCEKGVLGI
jgi:hypothetical protein